MDLRHNTILITGGTSGFGYEFAARLLELGNTVLITGRNQAKLDDTKRRLPRVHTFQSDVSDPQAIQHLYQQVVSQFPALNILINNAGEMRKLNLQDPTLDLLDLTREVEINLSGPIRMVQQFLPHLKTQQTAAILNVTSGLALTPFPLAPIYGGTKAGLRAYTKALRVQLQPTQVKVFELVAPAAKTPLADPFAGVMDESMLMDPGKLIAQAIEGLQQDRLEIYPGLSRVMRYMSRLAPGVLLKQMSKGVIEAFAQPQGNVSAR
ncbi:SDR family oxidoreductase [Hymenobacter cellulosilyticus]|uniref:SDR family NAD(P)-dependent oxidoreductase n=1 Tax=Hymenobacter cellulosilyticus TaxID=2932248 RepID=A0A8T9Q4V8_9BACT|nr:SDR family NAD(P)-dependent oxidoreductase [Hymenobacter cellulosilyticus]UOQ72012.1 SDR family NAD(P)-dependent oxidoreductase [Hymenobacter cellulosilyticus]